MQLLNDIQRHHVGRGGRCTSTDRDMLLSQRLFGGQLLERMYYSDYP